jgi:MSHA pilin protein MshD
MQFSHYLNHSYQKGFTLIETIVGMVVLAISFSILTTLIYPVAQQSADQLHQVKAAELAQSVLNEIQNKAFDNNSDMAGGRVRCGDIDAGDCSTAMGPDTVSGITETIATFNDVDEYNLL